MQVNPQKLNGKGKSNMVYDDEVKRHHTDKWMISVVIEQGKLYLLLLYIN